MQKNRLAKRFVHSTRIPSIPFAPLQQSSGSTTITYVYDPLNRLTEANYSTNDYYHYTYDAVGNRKSQEKMIIDLLSTDSYNYDNANRLTDVNGVTYTFDANGNLLNDGVNAYTYDSANRLKTFNRQGMNATYAYNGLGDRIGQTVNGNTTNYTLDLNTGLTQALSDGTNTYVYGLGRIAQTQGGTTEYFLGDALGSVRQMANQTGAISYARAYDPYGTATQTSGASQTAYGYTGEFTSNDLVYLRARYYASDTGRFTTKDSWMGEYNRPLSLNRWNYVEGNPVNYTDPSGHCFTSDGWRVFEYPIIGQCTYHGDDVISPTNPHYHNYSANNVVCPAYLSCSQAEIADAMIRFAYPGQNPSEPVHNGSTTSVQPFKDIYPPWGAIEAVVSDDHLTTANKALPTHIFYAGRVDRKATLSANGDWVVSSRGTGNNIFFAMDVVNQVTGTDIFNIVDLQMRIYITENHFKNWLQNRCSTVLIPKIP